ncbi:MAG: hypothetical protein NT007_00370 [Candidatus Kapabacteria bacterium]|nr:hypothetical protein [Candidatus Kapabacteria bacterium]
MSRSYKKHPYRGACADSEKEDKRRANRDFRRNVKDALHHGKEIMPLLCEVSDEYNFAKDGKYYDEDFEKKKMRK